MGQELATRHIALGEQAMTQGEFGQAEANFRYVTQLQPENADAHFRLALALSSLSKADESYKEIQKALALNPNLTIGYTLLSSLCQRRGEFEQAIAASKSAIKLNPSLSKPYVDIVNSKQIDSDDQNIIDPLFDMLSDPMRSSGEKIGIYFALGKAFNDTKQFEQAIKQFDAGNSLAKESLGGRLIYNHSNESQAASRVADCFDAKFLEAHRGLGSLSELPILIVGMIRSGTTLLDAVLSSHPEVASAGEQLFWEDNSLPLLRNAYKGNVNPAQLTDVADRYRRCLRAIGLKSKRVIDKMPINYQHIGLIHLAFPNARFIHCRRNPVDTCLSIFMTDFGLEPPRFAFSRPNIVHAYREYLKLMDHWRKVIPSDRFIEVDYEDLVLRRQEILPRLIEFLGLEWEESVLRHEDNRSDVATPSRWQARQPIYTRSLERWRNYEPWLGEFSELI